MRIPSNGYGDSDSKDSPRVSRRGTITRRELLRSAITIAGGVAGSHLVFDKAGLAAGREAQEGGGSDAIQTETITYSSGNSRISAFLAKPSLAGVHPAVLVIHANRGLNGHYREIASRFASNGYLALAPDLLSRVGGTGSMGSPSEATLALGKQSNASLLNDLKAGFANLAQRQDVDSKKISSVGFSWGGWRSLMLATMEPELFRSVAFYGTSPNSGYERIQSPVLAHYAQWDYRITGNAAWTEEKMRMAGKKFQYHIYPTTANGFFDDTGGRYDPDASRLAWERTLAFLRS